MNLQREEWMTDAACAQVSPDLWFPGKNGDPNPAKKICGGCDVRAECLAYALRNNEDSGIWGGLSASQRAAYKKAAAA